jgi:diguanylate cyclase (GGDEF)-like protein
VSEPALRPFVAPAAILALAAWLAYGTLHPTLSGVRTYGPYFVLGLGAAAALWFNRGRAFVALASLLVAYAGYRYALDLGAKGFPARVAYLALVVLVPANVLVALALPERGALHHAGYRWLLLIAAEFLLVAWIASAGRSDFSGIAWQKLLDHQSLRGPPTPWVGRIVFAAAFAAAVARAWHRHTPLEVGLAGALIAFFVAAESAGSRGALGTFISAAGAMLVFAILQESHRMAFRDELTGLPGRRALEERLRGLGPQYAIAMVDVDHFKRFNDLHGHDVGDQVLKLVASRLAEFQGGGRAFRYGGEEFTVLFPAQTLEQALPQLERMRAAIEGYRMTVRGDDRPRDLETGAQRRASEGASARPARVLSVTVSIGVAEPSGEGVKPAQVIRAADDALYRAKEAGRNRVSV